jgi:hypothetical protein
MKHFQIGKFVVVSLWKSGRSRYQVTASIGAAIGEFGFRSFTIQKGDRQWGLWNAKGVEVVRDTTAQALINVLVYGDRESVVALAEQEFAAL